jgi:pSer/pThr/pTyr-binding forkhead associated (FHA) protein
MAPMAGHARQAVLQGTPGTYVIVEGKESRVGRDPAFADICLTEPRVSGSHALVKIENGQLYIRDEGSNNGTFVAGGKIQSHVWTPVPPGGAVRFGPIEFNVRLE